MTETEKNFVIDPLSVLSILLLIGYLVYRIIFREKDGDGGSSKFTSDTTLEDDYEIQKVLGRGGFGVVRLVTKKQTGEDFAAKEVSKVLCDDIEGVYYEVEMMNAVKHKNIVKCEDVYEDEKSLKMVLELMRGGELNDYLVDLDQYEEGDAASALRVIFQALDHMHSLGIVHRDLKPENLCFVTEEHKVLKIIDLGLSQNEDRCAEEICGTTNFMAPEIFDDNAESYGPPVDLWAMGIITYICLCGDLPWDLDEDLWDNFEKFYSTLSKHKLDLPKTLSNDAQNFIKELLQINPEKRMTAKQALKSPWLSQKKKHTAKISARKLKNYQLRQKLRRGVMATLALKRIVQVLQD